MGANIGQGGPSEEDVVRAMIGTMPTGQPLAPMDAVKLGMKQAGKDWSAGNYMPAAIDIAAPTTYAVKKTWNNITSPPPPETAGVIAKKK